MRHVKPSVELINGLECEYYGELPKRRAIYISCNGKLERESLRSIYTSSLEAGRNGYDVITSGISQEAIDAIRDGTYAVSGTFHIVTPYVLKELYQSKISKALISGGSVIATPSGLSSDIALYYSSCLLSADGYLSKAWLGYYFLDQGRDVAIFKGALGVKELRSFARDGAPIITSFSDLLQFPEYIVYPDREGSFSKGGENFNIMRVGR